MKMNKMTMFIIVCLALSMLGGCSGCYYSEAFSPEMKSDGDTGYDYGMEAMTAAEDYGMAFDAYMEEPVVFPGEYPEDFNTEEYNTIKENGFEYVSTNPLSTFAADVDTGSYCNLRRMINDGYSFEDIPSGAVRTEEIDNYFDYVLDEANVTDGKFSVQYYIDTCPWNEDNLLLVMTATANDVNVKSAGNNFVYLIDSSGSMYSMDKLEMAIKGFKKLTRALGDNDIVSIVTYAGDSDVLVEGCPAKDYETIFEALDRIEADGGTNGSGGITAAYDCAKRNYIENGNNRVIIASDGDMNLGVTSQSGLVDLIKEKKDSGIFLTTLGFGSGNYSDANMEQIADAGNGNYYYIDNIKEAERVLVDKLMQTTVTVAKDVKFQAEFNPNTVSEYRLIGYENRTMSAKDFEDDTKDGGEVGAGQQVTVVYELVPADGENDGKDLKYQETKPTGDSDDILTLSVRYKHPKKDESELEEHVVTKESNGNKEDWSFVAGLTEFSLVLHDSDYKGKSTLNDAVNLLEAGMGSDEYRQECCKLIGTLADDHIEYNDPEPDPDEEENAGRTLDLTE
ncbi:MAG: von Willebrand factor type A domain-containing protein [Lachnospiraceae bacterium]|nr:von Willebrand factor type A domain-containing protein [Lachnospiraceae bacterium]